MKQTLLPLFLCFGVVSSQAASPTGCKVTPLSLKKPGIVDIVNSRQALFFQLPEKAQVMSGVYPGSKEYSVTVVRGDVAEMVYSNGQISIDPSIGGYSGAGGFNTFTDAASALCSPLTLWTGAAGAAAIMSGNRHVDRAVIGTTAVLAASSLMNVALADNCKYQVYFNIPNYKQDSEPVVKKGKMYVAFRSSVERQKVDPIKVKDGTCSFG